MSTEDIKDFLYKSTGVPVNQWSRVSKKKLQDGSYLRVFKNKQNSEEIQVIEDTLGNLTVDTQTPAEPISNQSNKKNSNQSLYDAALKLVKRYTETFKVPLTKEYGYAAIPSLFTFAFTEDVNDDWYENIEGILGNGNYSDSVDQMGVFIWPLEELGIEECVHYGPLLKKFLKVKMDEFQEGSFQIQEDISYKDFFETMKSKGFLYDYENCQLADFAKDMGSECNYYQEYDVVKKDGVFFLEDPEDKTYGPYHNVEKMAEDVEKLGLSVSHTPEFLSFTLEDSADGIVIYLSSKLNPSHDNLGGHNVTGLPFNLDAEGEVTECTWLVNGADYSLEQVREAMLKNGFIEDK